jgi:peroxisomal 2,4-dienoyl-CoA reductase
MCARMSHFRPDLLADRVALLTGGGSGITLGIARAFAAHGATTVLVGRTLEKVEAAAAAIAHETGRPSLGLSADVRDEDAVRAAVATTVERFGRLDVLVNGAAGNFLSPAATLKPKGYRTVLDIDAVGTYTVSRAAFDAWMKDHGGVILNISATLQYLGTPWQVHAASAKAAVDVQTRVLAVEWGPLGIRVVGLAPGPIDGTEGMARLAPGRMRQQAEKGVPLGRFGTIGEMADAALFLVSDAASYVHGETLVADGGAWVAGGFRLPTG